MTEQDLGQPDAAMMPALPGAGGRTWQPPEAATGFLFFWILGNSCSHCCLCDQLWPPYKCWGTAVCHIHRVPPHLLAEINHWSIHTTQEAWSCAEIQCQNRKQHRITIFVSYWMQSWAVLMNLLMMGTQTELEWFGAQLNIWFQSLSAGLKRPKDFQNS